MKDVSLHGSLILMLAMMSGCNPDQQNETPPTGSPTEAKTLEVDPLTAVAWKSRVVPDIVYHRIDDVDVKLDIWIPDRWLGEDPWWKPASGKKPTLL